MTVRASTFTFTIPSMRQRTQIGVAEARMRDGVKAEDLDPLTRSLINQLCFLSVTVTCPDGIKFTEHTDPLPHEQCVSGGPRL